MGEYDNSTKAIVLKNVTKEGEGIKKIIQNCVTSLWMTPKEVSAVGKKICHVVGLTKNVSCLSNYFVERKKERKKERKTF